MRKLLSIFILVILSYSGLAQDPFKLNVQPGKPLMPGDGLDYTTIVITARNEDGEVLTNKSGKVKVGISSGVLDETEVTMQNGVALVKFTAPMFGTPIKSSQRMVYFLFKFMQKFIGRSAGSTDYQANQKLATEIAMETFKEGLNPVALVPQKEGDNFVYIVCDLNGVKGKAKIEISKESDSPNGNIIPGLYYGRDITGQSDWFLDISSGGQGIFGEASGTEQNANTILFTTENFTEFNDAMGKMAGMTGFMKAYLGPPESETSYVENYNIREMGMPSAYMPMPKNGVFVYVPPILFEYAGRKANDVPGGTVNDDTEELKFEKTGIILSQDKIVGDGRSRTRAVFHYEDENGLPVAGKTISWDIPRELKVISSQTVTDASGNTEVVLEAPVIKATEVSPGGDPGNLTENYSLFFLKVNYTSSKNKAESTQTTLCIYKTLEQDLYILKPGMETAPYKVLLPKLEYYNLESSIYALLPESFLTVPNKKTAVNDAVVFLGSTNFDKAGFQKLYDTYFKKDRKLFMMMLENEKGGFSALTDVNGKFKLIVRDFEGKKRLFMGEYDRKMSLEPLQAKIADLTGRRTGALTEVLGLLSAGADASGNMPSNDGSFTGMALNNFNYKEQVLTQLLKMENVLCSGNHADAMYVEEKLHIIGMLMTNAKGTARFMNDTGKEVIENGWSLLGMAWEYANEKFKITENLGKKVGLDKVSDSLAKIGMRIDLGIWSSLTGTDRKTGTKRIIIDLIKKNVLSSNDVAKNSASVAYYRMMGQAANAVSGAVWESLTEGISDAISEANPVPDMVVEALRRRFYAGLRTEIDKFLAQPPEKVHAIYPQLREALRDRSTDIRSYYQDIAASRFNMEMYKADWDLFREVVVKGGIIIYDIKTLNWANVKTHLENLDKFNKVTDAAYTATKFGMELWRYHNLWCEARGAFDFTNRSIDQGVLVTYLDEPEVEFSLFTTAYAGTSAASIPVAGIAGLTSLDFSLKGSQLPIDQLTKAAEAAKVYQAWLLAGKQKTILLQGFQPQVAGAMYKAGIEYENELALLIVSALAYAQEKSPSSRQAYEAAARNLKTGAAALEESTGKAQSEIENLPEKVTVPVEAIEKESYGEKPWQNPLYQKIAAGTGVLLLIVVASILLIRRKRRRKTLAPGPVPPPPVAPVYQAPPAPNAPKPQQTPVIQDSPRLKFCPKCGNQLKPGAKFCGKCGHHL
ncbi:MAG: zinc ribbon domain-containing protein [Lentimicrobium sp.]|nr:zinc ribbon domain-containing protein [Lentimicrobium sp.]